MQTQVIFGLTAIVFGCLTLFLRLKKPEKLGKLKAMQLFWGKRNGNIIHFISYTIVPMVFGAVMLIKHYQS
ncbi:MAG TPA: hypothetical protein PKC21_10120 [Oligoflexia bacterium]|nr:hypothetical protein [Oligoflexia bacterium]HMR25695.1 hypothetical protein [Oligoflexia bacterium]